MSKRRAFGMIGMGMASTHVVDSFTDLSLVPTVIGGVVLGSVLVLVVTWGVRLWYQRQQKSV